MVKDIKLKKEDIRQKSTLIRLLTTQLYQINNTGDYVENKKITFQEVYTEFIENEAPATRAYATIVRYKSLYRNHFANRFDSFYMYQIGANSIDDFINEKMTKYSEEYVKGLL